jgi:hypothetical protein
VTTALLLFYLIKRYLQTHAHCASSRFIDRARPAKACSCNYCLEESAFLLAT